MSNAPSNKQQNQLIELTREQQDPGLAKPSDFTVNRGPLTLPPQHGDSRAEESRLIAEGMNDLGKSKPRPIPDRHVAPKQPSARYL